MRYKIDYITLVLALVFSVLKIWAYISLESNYVGFTLLFCGISSVVWSIKHNHIHLSIFVNKYPNYLFDGLLMLHTGSGSIMTRVFHVQNHHRHNNKAEDWSQLEKTPKFSWRFLTLITYPFWIIPKIIKSTNAFIYKTKRKSFLRKYKVEKSFFLILVLISLIYDPLKFLLFMIIPFLFSNWLLVLSNYIQHYDCDPEDRWKHANNITGWLYNLLFFNVGYHTAHHENESLHWSELKSYHQQHIRPHLNGEHESPSFLGCILSDFILSKPKAI